MIEVLDRSKSRPVPCGLVSTLRSLEVGESIIVSERKKSSIHPAAKRAGVRMTIRTLGDGTVCAWRVPAVSAAPPEAAATGPAVKPKPVAAGPGPYPVVKTALPASKLKSGYISQPYGPSIFVAETDIFGQPMGPRKTDTLS